MSIINQCKAKNPETCRYHKPNADTIAYSAMLEAKAHLTEVAQRYIETQQTNPGYESYTEYMQAKHAVEDAENEYYATNSGLADLLLKMEKLDPEDPKLDILKHKMEVAKWNIAEQEKRNEIDNAAGGPLIPGEDYTYVPPTFTGGGNELWPETTGSNYDRNLRGVQLKARINAEFKKAQKEGYLPKHLKFKITSRGNSVTCCIIGATDEQLYSDPNSKSYYDRTEESKELEHRAEVILSSFNHTQYDEIEGRRNYGHFWDRVEFENSWDRERRLAREAAKAKA